MTKSVKSTRGTTPMYGDQTYVLTYLGEDNRSYVIEKGLFDEVSVSDLQELRAFMGEERGRYLSKVLNMSDNLTSTILRQRSTRVLNTNDQLL